MDHWHLIPWTLQYLVGGACVFGLTLVIYLRNRSSLSYQSFFIYGVTTAGWLLLAFFHRNAPTSEISGLFFRFDILLVQIGLGFLPVFVFCVWNAKKRFFLIALPNILGGIYFFIMEPYEIFLSNFGWSYKFEDPFGNLFIGLSAMAYLLFIIACIRVFKVVPSKGLSQKYRIVFIGYLIFFALGMSISTIFLQKNPQFPPLGGILSLFQFMFIAVAAFLQPKQIVSIRGLKGPGKGLAETYITYLNRFRTAMPGTELGENIFRFQDYIEAMGLNHVVVSREGALVFDVDKFSPKHMVETPENIIRLVKELPASDHLKADLGAILEKTYQAILSLSSSEAKEWLQGILAGHSGFLLKNQILANFVPVTSLPPLLLDVKPGQAVLFKEDTPQGTYALLKGCWNHAMGCLCITKLTAKALQHTYNMPKDAVLTVGFEKNSAMLDAANLPGLTRAISTFLSTPDGIVLLMDCLDQIKFSTGFENAMAFLKKIHILGRQHNVIFLVTLPPKMFETREMEMIEVELNTGDRQ